MKRNKIFFALICFSAVFNSVTWSQVMPSILNLPNDFDTIIETTPVLVWQSDPIVLSDPRMTQRLVLVEKLLGQSKSTAISVNSPFILQEGIIGNSYSYSSSDPLLQKGHTYCWNVSYLFDNVVNSVSLISEFTIERGDTVPKSFIPLRTESDQSFHIVEDNSLYVMSDLQLNDSINKIQNNAGDFVNVTVQQVNTNGESIAWGAIASNYLYKVKIDALNLNSGNYIFIARETEGSTLRILFSIL